MRKPSAIQTRNRIQVSTGQVEHQVAADQRRTATGSTGENGTRKGRLQVGTAAAQHGHGQRHEEERRQRADVDHELELADRGQRRDEGDDHADDDGQIRSGVPVRGLVLPSHGGSSQSRDIAKTTREVPMSRVMTTVVRPATAPAEISVA